MRKRVDIGVSHPSPNKGGRKWMGLSNRVLLFLFSFCVAVLAIFGVSLGLPFLFQEEQIIDAVQILYGDVWSHVVIVSMSLVMFLLSLHFLWVSFRQRRGIDPGIDRTTEIGEIRISIYAIEEIAMSAGKTVKGVHDLAARVYLDEKESTVRIGLKMIVDGKTPLQQLSETLQQTVKEKVENVAGVEVDQVSVYVSRTKKTDQKNVRVS